MGSTTPALSFPLAFPRWNNFGGPGLNHLQVRLGVCQPQLYVASCLRSIRNTGVGWSMLEPGTGDRFFADLTERRIGRVSRGARSRCIDHPHGTVAVHPRDHSDMCPVLPRVRVRAEEEDQIARFRAAGAEAYADSGVVLQLAGARQNDANGAEDCLDEAAAVDTGRGAAAERVARAEPGAGLS